MHPAMPEAPVVAGSDEQSMNREEFQIFHLGTPQLDNPAEGMYFCDDAEGVLLETVIRPGAEVEPVLMQRAGPRRKIFFDPEQSHAAIVTCGGLCPGLNDVIRAITLVLWHRYGVRRITGLRYGYEGLVEEIGHADLPLTPDVVEEIHLLGGTILGSSRGPQDIGVMVDYLESHHINMLFTIGGDGTQRGAWKLTEEIERRGLSISVVGVPKTIDNDIQYTQRTFGFSTAVSMSQLPISCAHREAKGVFNGVGLVRLMGREAGFVAAYATLASSDVNLVLVPEVDFHLEKVLKWLEERLARKAHAVIVVAEGAGQNLVAVDGFDQSGNRKLGDIGVFLKQAIMDHFGRLGIRAPVKYIDPSYTIRSAPANAVDSAMCFLLASDAVHAAMAGKTAMVTAVWNGLIVHVPMRKAVEKRKRIDPHGPIWQSVLDNTGQPPNLT